MSRMAGLGRIAGLIALVCVLVACNKPDRSTAGEASVEARARVAAHAAQRSGPIGEEVPAGSEQSQGLSDEQRALVVAKIGNTTVTLGDVERQLAAQPSFSRQRYRNFEQKVEFLNNLVRFELLAAEAQRRGYDSDPDVVLAMKRAMIQEFTAHELRQLVQVSRIELADVERFYQNNLSNFQKPEQVRVSHILFDDGDKAAETAAEIQAALEADPARGRVIFSDFVRRLSKDETTIHINGDLGFVARDGYLQNDTGNQLRMPAPVVEAAFALRGLNAMSPVVAVDKDQDGTPDQWYLVQITNRRPAVNRTLEDARRQITNVLLRERQDKAKADYIRKLREDANVQVFNDVLQQLNVDEVQSLESGSNTLPSNGLPRPVIPAGAVQQPASAPSAPAASAPPAAPPTGDSP